jgi:histidinol dehydrogenase
MTTALTPPVPQTRPAFRITGAITELAPADRAILFGRAQSPDDHVRTRTTEIIQRVRRDGDRALRELAYSLDGVALEHLEVPRTVWRDAANIVAPDVRAALERAARNIRLAHEAWRPTAGEVETEPGVVVGRRPDPLARVGIYAPGGRALYPSSVLMGAIPARVAGVGEIVMCSPPGPSGMPAPITLAAAGVAGVDRVFSIGGAGAIAALAYGTESVPRADRIVGPGNAYVAAAKLQVAPDTSIDAPAGPSELLVITDHTDATDAVAREVVAQAEHDPDAAVVVVATSAEIAAAIARAVQCLVPFEKRADIIAASLNARGALLVAPDLAAAIRFSNDWAPEHLLLALTNPRAALPDVRNAGTVCLGTTTSVVFGDYISGANHVLPTGGAARRYSGLSTLDFVRWTTYQWITEDAARSLAHDTALLATAERLPAHAAAATRRLAPR